MHHTFRPIPPAAALLPVWFSCVHIASDMNITCGLQASVLESLAEVRTVAGLATLESFRVEHCAQAFGIVLEGSSHNSDRGWKVAFSGDTRPCQAVIDAARNADLLVHEVLSTPGVHACVCTSLVVLL